MLFRETTQDDLDFMDAATKHPKCIDYMYTLEHEDVPIMIGGFRLITNTTAWCWCELADGIEKHLVTAYRLIRDWIDEFAKAHGIRRMQAAIRTDKPEAARLVGHLHFKFESIMDKFFDDEDGLLFVRII